MTQQKDLKRLVRDRQRRTGESYMTALRHVRGQAPTPGEPILVEELVDLSEAAALIGLTCGVLIQSALAARIDTGAALLQLRGVLRATRHDPAFAVMRMSLLDGERPPDDDPRWPFDPAFTARVRAGVGGISRGGSHLAFTVAGRERPEMAVFRLWRVPRTYSTRPPILIITTPEGLLDGLPTGLAVALR